MEFDLLVHRNQMEFTPSRANIESTGDIFLSPPPDAQSYVEILKNCHKLVADCMNLRNITK